MIDFQALNIEITTDPLGFGYSVDVANGSDGLIAQKINQIQTGRKITVDTIDGQKMMQPVDITEYAALSAAAQRAWSAIISSGNGEIEIKNNGTRKQIAAIWGPGTTTRANLSLLQTRDGSRAEELFGAGILLTSDDVAKALGRG